MHAVYEPIKNMLPGFFIFCKKHIQSNVRQFYSSLLREHIKLFFTWMERRILMLTSGLTKKVNSNKLVSSEKLFDVPVFRMAQFEN